MKTKFLQKAILILFLFASQFQLIGQPEIEWELHLGGSGEDLVFEILKTSDAGYIAVGYTSSEDGDVSSNNGMSDIWLVKVDALGNLIWEKSYGGSKIEVGYSIQQTADEGYIIAGTTESIDGDLTENKGNFDFWVLKLDNEGVIEWEKNYGGSEDDSARSIRQTLDGGYVIAGITTSIDGDISNPTGSDDSNSNYWLLKIDQDGTIEWEKNYGGGNLDHAYSIEQTTDGGYIVAGITKSMGEIDGDYWILKLDQDGVIEWEKTYGGSRYDLARVVQQTADGGYIIAGHSRSNDGDISSTDNTGDIDCWILKIDAEGIIEWENKVGGTNDDGAYSIQQEMDGGYVVASSSSSQDGDVNNGNNGNKDYWILKLDNGGAIEWEKNYGGLERDVAYSIQLTEDGGYIVAGVSASSDADFGNRDAWIVKLFPNVKTSVAENNNIMTIESFPNPIVDVLTIESREQIDEISIYNLLGNLVLSETPNMRSPDLDMSSFSAGIYLVEIRIGDDVKTIKVTK